jgi:hypothetical protein
MLTMPDTIVKRVGKPIGGATIVITPNTFTVAVPLPERDEVKKKKAAGAPKKGKDASRRKVAKRKKVRRLMVRRHSKSREKELGALLALLMLCFPNDVNTVTRIIRELVYWLVGRS